MIREIIAVVLIAIGLFIGVMTVIGLFRFRTTINRMHAGAMADSLGVLVIMVGLAVLCGFTIQTAKLMATVCLLWMINPLSSHLIAKTELFTNRDIDAERDREAKI